MIKTSHIYCIGVGVSFMATASCLMLGFYVGVLGNALLLVMGCFCGI